MSVDQCIMASCMQFAECVKLRYFEGFNIQQVSLIGRTYIKVYKNGCSVYISTL